MELAGGTLADEFMMDFEEEGPAAAGEQEVEKKREPVAKSESEPPASLRSTARFASVMADIEGAGDVVSFDLIAEANELVAEVAENQERMAAHIKDLYRERFAELASLVPDKAEYVATVRAIGNEMDITQVDLDAVLPGHTSMIVRIGASTSAGRPLSDVLLRQLHWACSEFGELEAARRQILAFVQSKMSLVAPNLSELVGTEVAALLVTAAGGLDKLGSLPANAVRVLGIAGAKNLQGMSTASQIEHVGYLKQCDLLHGAPQSVRTQAVRVLAGRVALAARVDAQAAPGAVRLSVGKSYREEVEAKLEKWLAPLPPRQLKALPVPKTGEGKTVKRGGEQARRKKAKLKMTELRKQQNRLGFGEVKEEGLHDLMGGDLGMIGSAMGTGKVKIAVEDTGILKGLSKKRKLEIAKALEPGQGSRTSFGRASHLQLQGTKSSLALEGDRGIELVEKTAPSSAPVQRAKKYFGGASFLAPAPKSL